MFNPKSFKTSTPKSITLCNSAHSLAKRAPMVARQLPGVDSTYYVAGNDGTWTATIDTTVMTLGVYDYGVEELRRRVEAKEFLGEVVDIPKTDKYIANAIVRELAILTHTA